MAVGNNEDDLQAGERRDDVTLSFAAKDMAGLQDAKRRWGSDNSLVVWGRKKRGGIGDDDDYDGSQEDFGDEKRDEEKRKWSAANNIVAWGKKRGYFS